MPRPCHFFGTARGCNNGDSCRYLHSAPVQKEGRRHLSQLRDARPAVAAAAAAAAPLSPGMSALSPPPPLLPLQANPGATSTSTAAAAAPLSPGMSALALPPPLPPQANPGATSTSTAAEAAPLAMADGGSGARDALAPSGSRKKLLVLDLNGLLLDRQLTKTMSSRTPDATLRMKQKYVRSWTHAGLTASVSGGFRARGLRPVRPPSPFLLAPRCTAWTRG